MKDNKILENAAMSDEELDQVAGGSIYEIADDNRFLNVLLHGREGQCDRHSATYIYFVSGVDEVKTAWKTVGIEMIESSDCFGGKYGKNTYKLDGKEISREQAWAHAEKVVGKTLKESDWNW